MRPYLVSVGALRLTDLQPAPTLRAQGYPQQQRAGPQ